ncbi:MAG: hypothetical protein ABJA82_09810 [Myxococcales bacterium]
MRTKTKTPTSGPILVLSAFEPELAPLRAALARGVFSPGAVRCVPAGIGAVDAAIGAAREIGACRPRLVLFVGTAGSYGATAPVGAVVVGQRIVLASTAAARRDGYLPGPMSVAADTDSAVRQALLQSSAQSPLLLGDVATPLAITSAARLGQLLARTTGAAVENLEAFAVARAAALAGIPFGAVLGVSNQVGPGAHAQWLRHRALATRAACRVVEDYLAAVLNGKGLRAPNRLSKAASKVAKPVAPRRLPRPS